MYVLKHKRRKPPPGKPDANGVLIKTPEQIAGIRKSCQLAAASLEMIKPYVIPGTTTLALNDRIEQFIRDHKAIPAPLNYNGFPKACCISLNEVICHGIPDETVIRDGDILNIDVTTILNGYYGDTSKMFTVGPVTPAAEHLIKVTEKCLEIGISQVRSGSHLSNIGYEINNYATSQNCSVVEAFCGHGVGIGFHEAPRIIHKEEKRGMGLQMQPGWTFTIEPMICLGKSEAVIDETDGWTARTSDGNLSAQFEHTLLVTSQGCEILTLLDEPSRSEYPLEVAVL